MRYKSPRISNHSILIPFQRGGGRQSVREKQSLNLDAGKEVGVLGCDVLISDVIDQPPIRDSAPTYAVVMRSIIWSELVCLFIGTIA